MLKRRGKNVEKCHFIERNGTFQEIWLFDSIEEIGRSACCAPRLPPVPWGGVGRGRRRS
jgi:hypothetical protein